MEKKRFYYIIILVLIFSNGVLLALLLNINLVNINPKKDPSEGRGPRKEIIKRLKFTDSQIAQYDELIRWHRKNIKQKDQEIRSLKQELYSNNQLNNLAKDSRLTLLSNQHYEIEKIH